MNVGRNVCRRELELLSKIKSRQDLREVSGDVVKKARCRHIQNADGYMSGIFNPFSSTELCEKCNHGFIRKGGVTKSTLKELEKATSIVLDYLHTIKGY